MSKYTYRFPLVRLYDIGRYEHWLGDMAAKGLFFVGTHPRGLAKFERGEPEKRRYRLEPMRGVGAWPPTEERELYEEMGWHFETCVNGLFYLFSAPDRPDVPELHTEPAVDAELYEAAYDKAKRNFRLNLRAFLLLCAAHMVLLFGSFDSLAEVLLLGGRHWHAWILAAAIVELIQCALALRQTWRLRRQLSAGVPVDHRESYRLRMGRNAAGWALYAAFILAIVMSGARPSDFAITESLPTLAEIEDSYAFVHHRMRHSGRETESADAYRSFTAPCQIVSTQYGRMGEQECELRIKYNEMRSETLAELLYHSYMGEYDGTVQAPDDLTGFAQAALFEDGGEQVFLAQQGCTVLAVEYTGDKSLADHTARFADLLQKS